MWMGKTGQKREAVPATAKISHRDSILKAKSSGLQIPATVSVH
jgi:hypothetical protein